MDREFLVATRLDWVLGSTESFFSHQRATSISLVNDIADNDRKGDEGDTKCLELAIVRVGEDDGQLN